MNRSYDALAANWREQAGQYVRRAQRSASLRDIVRFIAVAAALEHAARKVTSGAEVNLDEVSRMISLDADPRASSTGHSITQRSTHHVDSTSADT